MAISTAEQINHGIDSGQIELQPAETELQRSIFVIFTSADATLKALRKAGELADNFRGKIVLIAVQEVPFPLPLDEPPVSMEFILKRFAETDADSHSASTAVVYICRDRLEALKQVLTHNAPILIGVRKRWWPTPDETLAGRLRRAGYAVISVETE